MTVDKQALEAEAVHHCETVWALVPAIRQGDRLALVAADIYLRDVKDTSGQGMHDVVMKMIERAAGISWEAIRDG